MDKVYYNQNAPYLIKMEKPLPHQKNEYKDRYYHGIKCIQTPEFHKLIDEFEKYDKIFKMVENKDINDFSVEARHEIENNKRRQEALFDFFSSNYAIDRENSEFVLRNDSIINSEMLMKTISNLAMTNPLLASVYASGSQIIGSTRKQL